MSWDDEYADLPEQQSRARSRGSFRQHPFQDAKSAIRFLKQEDFWADGSLGRIPIAEMEPDYLVATMGHLIKRAPALKLIIELYYRKNGAETALVEKLEKMSSERFIKETSLFQSMRAAYLAEPTVPDIFSDD